MFTREKNLKWKNSLWTLLRLQTQWSNSEQSKTSREMTRFLNTMRDKMFKTFLYYFSQPSRSVSWGLDESHNFQTSFAFYRLKNISKSCRFSCLVNKMFKNSTNFMNKILKWTQLHECHFPRTLLYSFMHLSFKLDFQKNPFNEINSLKIAKGLRSVPNWNIYYKVMYL
jgi:hypothetical protein